MGNSSTNKKEEDPLKEYKLETNGKRNNYITDFELYKHKTSGEFIWANKITTEKKNITSDLISYIEAKRWRGPMFLTQNAFIQELEPISGGFCGQPSYPFEITIFTKSLEFCLEDEIFRRRASSQVLSYYIERIF